MKVLIDGYNLMYARGLLDQRVGRDGFRKARERFLDELATALGPLDVRQTLVIFDAAGAPPNVPARETRKGLSIEFAVDVAEADALLEELISKHSAPRTLTVVSSDRRIRDAARRRGAVSLSCDEFLDRLDSNRARSNDREPVAETPRRGDPLLDDTDYWLALFGEIESDPSTRAAFEPDGFIPSDADIERIRREVEDES